MTSTTTGIRMPVSGRLSGWSRLGADAVVRRPWLLTAALCGVVLLVGDYGPDLPAQEYRSWLIRHHGVLTWNNQWYGGHTLLGYSLIAPLLGAWLGVKVVGAVMCVASTYFVARLLPDVDDPGQRWCRVTFAVATVADLVVGRTSFAIALAFALAALWTARTRRPVVAGILALLCSLTSPLAGLFLLLVVPAWLTTRDGRRALPLTTAALGIVVGVILGPGSGRFPFPTWHLLILEATLVAGLLFVPKRHDVIRRIIGVYAIASLIVYLVPNAVGANMLRLATIATAPLAVLVFATHRRRWLVVPTVTGLLIGWHIPPVSVAIADSLDDPSASASYFAPLLEHLTSRATIGRLEIPMTRNHWESYYVARQYPLARGWERQIDVADNTVLYHPLTASTYHQWLRANAVEYVALPDIPLDRAGKYEARILASPPEWLRPVWRGPHWRLWRVDDAEPLATPPGRVVDLDVSSFTVAFARPGVSTVHVHWSRLLQVTNGSACIAASPAGWVEVRAAGPGQVTVSGTIPASITRFTSNAPQCG